MSRKLRFLNFSALFQIHIGVKRWAKFYDLCFFSRSFSNSHQRLEEEISQILRCHRRLEKMSRILRSLYFSRSFLNSPQRLEEEMSRILRCHWRLEKMLVSHTGANLDPQRSAHSPNLGWTQLLRFQDIILTALMVYFCARWVDDR